MVLHDYFRSSAAFRVRIAVNLKGLAPARRYVHLRKGEQRAEAFLAVNPQGLVPVLEEGDFRLSQSLAIIEYLDEMYPEPPLMPATAADRAWVRSVALSIACDIHPLNNLRVLKHLGRAFGADQAAQDTWYRHWIGEGFVALEKLLATRPGPFCLGGIPTLADICLVPQVANARRFDVALDPYPRIRDVNARCLDLPAFALAQPERQPDAEN